MSALIRLSNRSILRNLILQSRSINTSQKNRETACAAPTPTVAGKSKNWVSWGFDYTDEAHDRSTTKASFFFSITLCLVVGGFVWAYQPDYKLRDWSQREAYLELRRREQAGLELVDPNFIDPATIELPSEEELANTEIII